MSSKAELSLVKILLSDDVSAYERTMLSLLAADYPDGVFSRTKSKSVPYYADTVIDTIAGAVTFTFTDFTHDNKRVKLVISPTVCGDRIDFEILRQGFVGGSLMSFIFGRGKMFCQFIPSADPGTFDDDGLFPSDKTKRTKLAYAKLIEEMQRYIKHDLSEAIIALSQSISDRKQRSQDRKDERDEKRDAVKEAVYAQYNITTPTHNIEELYSVLATLGSFGRVSKAFGKLLPLLKHD